MKRLILLLGTAALGSCQKQSVTPEAAPMLIRGQIVRVEATYDYHAPVQPQPSRFRWIVQLDAPLTIPGAGGIPYCLVKTFSLSDTTTYRTGTRIGFTYQIVPQAQQTPWLSRYEWLSAAPSPGYVRFAELALTNVERP